MFRVQGLGFRVQGSGFRVQGSGFGAPTRFGGGDDASSAGPEWQGHRAELRIWGLRFRV